MNAQSESAPTNAVELGLGAVLIDSLPPTLFTDAAPERYTVAAVFTRNPAKSEISAIHGDQTRAALRAAGYGAVELHVSNWRLEIANTNLDELAAGLAGVIAERLHVISEDSASADRRRAADALVASQRETDRAALVARAAAGVTFVAQRNASRGATPRDGERDAQRYANSAAGAAQRHADTAADQAAGSGSA